MMFQIEVEKLKIILITLYNFNQGWIYWVGAGGGGVCTP
jgi:hypothetical protein